MKKEYMKPAFEVVEIKTEAHLLAGSDPNAIDASFGNGEIDGWADSHEVDDILKMLMN